MAADLVNLEEGTGCVHIAPGHGQEDFEVGKEKGLRILCPVDESGKLTIEPYQGVHVKDSNRSVIEDLDKVQKYMHDVMGIGKIIDLEKFVNRTFADNC